MDAARRRYVFAHKYHPNGYACFLRELVDLGTRSPSGIAGITHDNAFSQVRNVAVTEAGMCLGRAAVAAAAYRIDHGEYPEALERMVPRYIEAVPTDPFDGKPIRATTQPDGLTLYSVGEDGEDDKGVETDWSVPVVSGRPLPLDAKTFVRLFRGDVVFHLGSAYKEHRRDPARARGARAKARREKHRREREVRGAPRGGRDAASPKP
jgi:hypothetical protein